jgi:hypothetical protein
MKNFLRFGWLSFGFCFMASVLAFGCGGFSQSALDSAMQNDCVRGHLDLPRTIEDGKSCYSFSYSDCGGFPSASECINYCAFDLCQPGYCEEDTDCAWLSINYECQNYIVSGDDYGKWCGETDCPKGTPGCPCLPDGSCYEPDEWWDVTCDADNTCQGGDGCQYGCRQGSVCCGGSLCSGDCIGTPCC